MRRPTCNAWKRQAALVGTLALCALVGQRDARSAGLSPPTSLKPEVTRASVRFRHVHRVVESCSARSGLSKCAPQLKPADAETELWLVPISTRTLRPRPDARSPVHVFLGRTGTIQEPLQVAPGTWVLAWPGYLQRPFEVAAGQEAAIRLETTSGKCERAQRKCSLDAKSQARTAVINVH